MNANYSVSENELIEEEDLEAVLDSGSEFNTDGEQCSFFTLSISQPDTCFDQMKMLGWQLLRLCLPVRQGVQPV